MWESLSPIWQACLEEAWSASCAGSVPIGAVVAGPQGQIISRNRNRISDRQGEPGLLYGGPLAHAEINALARLKIPPAELHGCHLYTTCEPCPLCLGAFYLSGVYHLHYALRDAYGGSANLLGSTPYLRLKPVQVYRPEHPVLETLLLALLAEYELRYNGDLCQKYLVAWQKDIPQGVRLGTILFRSGELQEMRIRGVSTGEVFERMECSYQQILAEEGE